MNDDAFNVLEKIHDSAEDPSDRERKNSENDADDPFNQPQANLNQGNCEPRGNDGHKDRASNKTHYNFLHLIYW